MGPNFVGSPSLHLKKYWIPNPLKHFTFNHGLRTPREDLASFNYATVYWIFSQKTWILQLVLLFRAYFRCSLALLGSIYAAFGLTYYKPVLSCVKNYVFHLFLDQATTSNTYKKMVQKESKLGSWYWGWRIKKDVELRPMRLFSHSFEKLGDTQKEGSRA